MPKNVYLTIIFYIFYDRHSNTLTTNTITCGVLLSVGDVIQQRLEKAMGKSNTANNKHDITRTSKLFSENTVKF